MNDQTAGRIGLPAKPIKAGGQTYSPQEVQALLKKLADLGINQDKIIAQITPKEASVLKALGGSGEINPRTGLMSFDDDGGGGSGNEGGGGWGGGWGGDSDSGFSGSDLGASGGEMGGANWSGEPAGGDPTGGDPTGGGPTDGNESYTDEYGRDVRDVYGAEYIGDRSNVTGSPGDATTGANIFSNLLNQDRDYSEFDDFSALSTNEAPNLNMIEDFIQLMADATARGEAADFLSNNADFAAAVQSAIVDTGNTSLQGAFNSAFNSAYDAALNEGARSDVTNEVAGNVATDYAPYYGVSPEQVPEINQQLDALYSNLGNVSGLAESAYGSLGAGPGPAGYASAWNTDTGVSGQGVGALGQTEAGQFGLSGPQGVSSTYGGLSNAGLSGLSGLAEAPAGSFPAGDIAGTTGLLTMGTEPGFVQGTAPTISDIYGPAVYMPTTVDTSPVVTAPVVTITKPATPVTPPTIEVAPVVPVTPVVPEKPVVEGETTGPTVEELLLPGGDGGEQWIRPTALVDDVVAPKTTTPTTSGATTTPKTVIPKEEARAIVEAIVGRRRTPYLQSYYTEGYNPEGLKFAMGGPVIPSAFPVTAYTDGQGPVGAVAMPPALTPFQSVGYDNVVGSPMAPAPAATAPSLSGMGPLSAYRNTNAMPVQSQVSQNPNVAASMGSGPLAQLFRR